MKLLISILIAASIALGGLVAAEPDSLSVLEELSAKAVTTGTTVVEGLKSRIHTEIQREISAQTGGRSESTGQISGETDSEVGLHSEVVVPGESRSSMDAQAQTDVFVGAEAEGSVSENLQAGLKKTLDLGLEILLGK